MGNNRDRGGGPSTDGPPPLWRRPGTGLIAILLLAAGLRLATLAAAPPGLHQDEAIRAWNAQCLLQAGTDHRGQSWPIFRVWHFGAAGGDPSYSYALMPFQVVFGMSVWTTRLPGALVGVLVVLLTYLLAARMFGVAVGLVAAGLLAVNPWAVQVDRLGFGVGFVSLFVVATLLLLSKSNLLGGREGGGPVRIGLAAAAGAVAGIGAYSYPAYRLFMPVLLLALLIVGWRDWRRHLRTRQGARAVAAFVLALVVTCGPLVWAHVADPDMMKRGHEHQGSPWVWNDDDGLVTKTVKALSKYPGHFGPDFLFVRGDPHPHVSPPDSGQLHWYVLPLLLAGAGVTIWRARSSVAARVLTAWVLLYPAGDLLVARTAGDLWGLHALRSSPGICALMILAAVGAVAVGAWLLQRRRAVALGVAAVLVLAAVGLNVRYYATYFGEYNDRKIIQQTFHADIVEACEWLKPRVDPYDAVFWAVTETNQPYMITLVAMDWDPARWFREGRTFITSGSMYGHDFCGSYGKMHFMYPKYYQKKHQELLKNGRADRVLFIVRPKNVPRSGSMRVLHQITRPGGEVALVLFEARL